MKESNRWDGFYQQSTIPLSEGFRYETLSDYTAKTFLWMFFGLLTTFGVAVAAYATNLGAVLFQVPGMFWILGLAEILLVVFLSARVEKMSVASARVLFFVYALVNGLVFSSYLWLFELGDVLMAFGAAALYFGAMAAYGYMTKRDLTSWKPMLTFGLIAMLVAGVLSALFLGGTSVVYSMLGVVLFACYTAYDTQKIKAIYFAYAGDETMSKKMSILAALQLYLDFINLFLYLLRIFARSNND
ncbi:Bax inhibitor-1 family protein [uncultured Allofournierella sp.]|uniref:Bax inhibitor-1/YccA family protein n=1 Tax=uncultured Allofournierella sp. TaxID=1940258 RepID=UPI0037535C66